MGPLVDPVTRAIESVSIGHPWIAAFHLECGCRTSGQLSFETPGEYGRKTEEGQSLGSPRDLQE